MKVFDTRHLLTTKESPLGNAIADAFSVTTERVSELLHLGSVYVEKKRVLEDKIIPQNSYVRVHLLPKRYPVNTVDWLKTIHYEHEHFIVVNKPAGFPVPSAVDNVRETVFSQVQKVFNGELRITQRLDVPTTGLMIFAKTHEFQVGYNKLLAEKALYKEYLARTSKPVTPGEHIHFMKPTIGAPRIVELEAQSANWKECRLRVLTCEPETSTPTSLCQIELLTGRTHQIRAQMKALSAPLWGDKIYEAPGPETEFLLQSRVLKFICPVTGEKMEFNARQ